MNHFKQTEVNILCGLSASSGFNRFAKVSLRNTIIVSKGMGPGQDQRFFQECYQSDKQFRLSILMDRICFTVSHFSYAPIFKGQHFFTKMLESNILYDNLLIDNLSV